jgi:hypothetical protein
LSDTTVSGAKVLPPSVDFSNPRWVKRKTDPEMA